MNRPVVKITAWKSTADKGRIGIDRPAGFRALIELATVKAAREWVGRFPKSLRG